MSRFPFLYVCYAFLYSVQNLLILALSTSISFSSFFSISTSQNPRFYFLSLPQESTLHIRTSEHCKIGCSSDYRRLCGNLVTVVHFFTSTSFSQSAVNILPKRLYFSTCTIFPFFAVTSMLSEIKSRNFCLNSALPVPSPAQHLGRDVEGGGGGVTSR